MTKHTEGSAATTAGARSRGSRASRFAQVGVINTIIDFVLYWLLVSGGTQFVIANLLSTSAGMTFGFFAHRRYSFRSSSRIRDTVVPFVTVTATGLWLIQPFVIWLTSEALDAAVGATTLTQTWLPKACAIGVGLVWNYALYHFVVFARPASSPHVR